jgi:hypothetical protein
MPKVKHNNGSPISLFSFQDIITSVTGIMILIVLLLILSILDKKMVEESKSKSAIPQNTKILNARVKILQKQVEREKLDLKALNNASQSNPKSLSTLLKFQEKEINLKAKNIAEIKRLKTELKEKSSRIDNLLKKRETLTKEATRISSDCDRDLRIKKEIEFYENKITKIEKLKNSVLFSVSRQDRKTAFFVICSLDGIEIRTNSGILIKKIHDDSNNFSQTIARFKNWLNTRNANKEYLLLILKPSSAGFSPSLMFLLNSQGFEYGLEPLQESKSLVF